jgi:hypothetical protein
MKDCSPATWTIPVYNRFFSNASDLSEYMPYFRNDGKKISARTALCCPGGKWGGLQIWLHLKALPGMKPAALSKMDPVDFFRHSRCQILCCIHYQGAAYQVVNIYEQ